MQTDAANIHTGIADMNLEESMHTGRASMNFAQANMNNVPNSIHIGIINVGINASMTSTYNDTPI